MKKFNRIREEHPELSEAEVLLQAEQECIEEGKINPFVKMWSEENKAAYLRGLKRLEELERRLAVEDVKMKHGRNKAKD